MVDKSIIKLLAKRLEIVREIWAVKKEACVDVIDKDRYIKMLKERKRVGRNYGLEDTLIQRLFEAIHGYLIDRKENFYKS